MNIIGKTDFTIYEDLCLISGQNNGRTISVYQLPNFNYLGSYVHVGNGPGEVLFPPFVGSISIKQQPDGIHAYFLNLKGGIIDWNVTKSIEAKATIANTTDLRLPNDVVGGYFGIVEMDEYSLKEYILNKYGFKVVTKRNNYYGYLGSDHVCVSC